MARLRFPGRPGQRIGKNYVKYVYDDVKMNTDACLSAQNKIEVRLKLFYELFGYSDEEEEEFDGFTEEDLIQAEAVFARSVKTKEAIQRYLETNQEPSSSAASDIEKIISSSDSDTAVPPFVRRRRGMRDILRRSYDKMLKHGLDKESVYKNSLYSKSKPCINPKCVLKKEPLESIEKPACTNIDNVNTVTTQPDGDGESNKIPEKTSKTSKKYFNRFLDRAKRIRDQREKSVRQNVKSKLKQRFVYSPSKKYSKSMQKRTRSSRSRILKPKLKRKSWPRVTRKVKSETKDPLSSTKTQLSSEEKSLSKPKQSLTVNKKINLSSNSQTTKSRIKTVTNVSQPQMLSDHRIASKSKHSLAVGRRRFILPSISARSSRKIIPRRRYIDELELPSNKLSDEDSRSRSSLSGSSEAISAMDGESSPDDEHSQSSMKKVGLLDQPLVVEGKRPWKPSLKVQMKLSEMNCDYPFALKKNMDGSSGTSSGSFKDIIKPDMVSKYAEKMAQKPKEKTPKVIECAKRLSSSVRNESERYENDSSDAFEENKKPGDKLEKVAAKIEKILKSQWEGRLKSSSKKVSSDVMMAQWKTEQQQRSSNQRRTKNILRKARLQLKKRNLRTRRNTKETSPNVVIEDLNVQPFAIKTQKNLSGLTADQLDVLNSSLLSASSTNDVLLNSNCVICGSSKLYTSSSKLYEQVTCELCNGFFESFVKTPKQYFCKDGNCCIDTKDSTSRRASTNRCKACWLKACFEKLNISPGVKEQIVKYVPRLDSPPHNPLLIVEDDIPVDEKDVISRGPRIKHVCRRAAVVLGLPRATFADVTEPKESFSLSALPEEEKQKILETVPTEEKVNDIVETETKSTTAIVKTGKVQGKKKLHKDLKVKNRVHLDLLKKSALLIHKEQKKKKLQMKKSLKQLHKHSFKKSLKLSKKNEMKKTVKFSYKSAVKTSMKTAPKVLPKRSAVKPVKLRKVRCKECEGCLAEDCGQCAYCLDKKKFGGPNLIKQACMFRRCLRPVLPASERRASKLSFSIHIDKGKPSGGHSSFGGDGPSGIGTSLTSSSSSPSSPDGSSCGSSCTSSSSSSSSGSSGSSNSSSSSSSSGSSSSSSSSSDNISVSNNPLINSCVESSLMPNFDSQSVILRESECTDNNVTIFPESMYGGNNFASDPTLQDLLVEKAAFEDVEMDCDYKDSADTIVYEDSSSIIELKNASFAPSLIYGASIEDGVVSSSTGFKNQNSQQNRNSRKSQFIDKDQYGSAGSGSNGDDNEDDDDDDDDDDEKKKQFVLADYWEDYDFERISSQGFALISSQQIPLPCVCYLCGSAGQEKLIFCVLCCEPYHTFCLPDNDVPYEENLENWCCKRCQSCAVCGLKNNLLKCKQCQNTYHGECLAPHYPTKPSRRKRIWVCPKCVKCKSCGTTSSFNNSAQIWNFDSLLCQPCSKLTDKGNYCPVCRKCYEENDYESEMVQCCKCNRWVHATCDNISGEEYEILSCLPETVIYTCTPCTFEHTPAWRSSIAEYRSAGLKVIINALLYSKCARYLFKKNTSQKKGSSYLSYNFYQDKESSDLSKNDDNISVTSNSELINPDFSNCEKDVSKLVSELVTLVDNARSETDKCDSLEFTKIEDQKSLENMKIQACCIDLMSIQYKLERGKYKSILSFFTDIIQLLEKGRNDFNKQYISAAKKIITKQVEKTFPFFKMPVIEVWTDKGDYPERMLPNAILPPSEDHLYSQYLERVLNLEDFKCLDSVDVIDDRNCVLCGYSGDSNPKKCGRLLYCGQDDWIHVNCAVWSAEVFQQQDGSLRNVYPAIARGKLMHCEFCNQLGATVGCCVRGCPANYHFYCARKDEAVLQEDKKVFCAVHKDHVDAKIMKDDDFIVSKKTFVHQSNIAPKWVKDSWQEAQDVSHLSVRIGALTVHKLGHLVALSDSKSVLIPVDYECSRMFWSTKNPHIQVKYTCRIFEVCSDDKRDRCNQHSNVTTVHFQDTQVLKTESKNVHSQLADLKINEKHLRCPSRKESTKAVSLFDSSDIPNAVVEDVIKVVQRLVKKVLKKQKKYWEKVRNKISPILDKGCDNGKSSFLGLTNSCKNESKVLPDVLDFVQEKSFDHQLVKDNSELKRQATESGRISNVNSVKSLASLCSDAIKVSLLIANNNNSSNTNNNSSQRKGENSKYFYSEIFNKYIQSTKLKELKKKLKYLNRQPFEISDKVMDLIADKEVAKEITDFILKRYKGVGDLPPKIVSLLDSILPSSSVNETVLPIFLAKENSGINESSGYSSNDDSHLRPPVLPQAVVNPVCISKSINRPHDEIAFKEQNKLKTNNDSKSGSAWMKDIKLNGRKDFSQNLGVGSNRSSRPNPTLSQGNVEVIGVSVSKIKNLNGISQSAGPFKCAKCKRLYRTNESFEKHCESCNFFVDSSTTEEESSDSSDGSEESSESSDENFHSDLSKFPLKKPLLDSIGKNSSATQNIVNAKQNLAKQSESCHNSRTISEKQTKQISTSVPRVQSNQTAAKSYKSLLPSNSVSSQQPNYPPSANNMKQTIQHQQKIVPCQQTINSTNNIQYQTLPQYQPPEGVVSNISLSANAVSNNYNIGFNNNICNNVPSGLVQLPCNTLIIRPGHEAIQSSNPILHLPQNNFYNAPLSANTQLSVLSGSVTITNNSFNISDQVLPVYQQPNINFAQPTILPSPIQMQQTGIQLSTMNVQQISLQGAFSSNSLSPFVFPQQTVNIPQNQVMFIEDPLSSNSQSQNLVFQLPVGQLDNNFTFVAPQQFVNPVTFNTNMQNNQNINQLPDQPKLIIQEETSLPTRPDSMPVLIPQVNANNTNQRTQQNRIITSSSVISPDMSYSPICASSTPSNSSCTTTPGVSSRSTPVPDSFHNSQSNIPQLTISSDSPIMDILKKAAEQVLSLSEKRKAPPQDQKPDPGAPEKKTRFAHTRKVAARRAEKLRLQKGSAVPRTEINKPKMLQVNIATIKPAFPIPVVPVSSCENLNEPVVISEAQPTEDVPDVCERSLRNNSKVISYNEESDEEESILLRIQKHETKKTSENGEKTKPYIMYEISCEDGFSVQSHSIRDAWEKVYDTLQDSRLSNYMKHIPIAPQDIDGLHMMGLDNTALIYLVEQLSGAESCKYYDFIFHKPAKEPEEVLENLSGCARSEIYIRRREYDMFNFLASEHRDRPIFVPPEEEDEGAQKATRRSTNLDMPIALRFKNLKTVARETVGVYRSSIHGRGLFCKRNIDAGELVIEYAGEVIRSILADKREKIYQSKGIGCYMFRIDDDDVVDATIHGNAARFINHSCEPNCFSKVITVDGKKHIVIFALRRITKGEELTYDYKFPFEEEKIPCHCNSRKCRKYLN